MTSVPRPWPRLTQLNRAFWTGGGDDELRIFRCEDCGYYVHPPVPLCGRCRSDSVRPVAVSGRARLFSYTVNHYPWVPGLATPYLIGLAELDEQRGLRLTTSIVDCPVEDVRIDMRLRVRFVQQQDIFFPVFAPSQD